MKKFLAIFLFSFLANTSAIYAEELEIKFILEQLQIESEIPFLQERIYSPAILFEVYEANDFIFFWKDKSDLKEAVAVLENAYKDGLMPADYHIDILRELIEEKKTLPEEFRVYVDLLVTDGLILFNYHLLNGKVNPENFDYAWNYPKRRGYFEINNVPFEGLNGSKMLEVVNKNRPKFPMYQVFKSERSRYALMLGKNEEPGLIKFERTLKPGDPSDEFGLILNRIAYLGFIPKNNYSSIDKYDSAWIDDIKNFQALHGQDADGIIGRKTFEMLNISLEKRIQDIDINMERLRWAAGTVDDEFIVVNIAGFHLYMVDNTEFTWETNVMTGAIDTQTPVFTSHIKYLVLNPTWTIPRSIIKKSLFDRIKKDPSYLTRNHYYLADKTGKKIDHTKLDWENMTIRTFTYWVVQEPGPFNALGRVKFMFPNKYAIYLHDTPSKSLFSRSSRAFSHGCIRVQNPLDLAEILLDDNEKYSMEKIEEIIKDGKTTNISLKIPKKILLAYLTVGITDSGKLTWHEDIYNRDDQLYEALLAELD